MRLDHALGRAEDTHSAIDRIHAFRSCFEHCSRTSYPNTSCARRFRGHSVECRWPRVERCLGFERLISTVPPEKQTSANLNAWLSYGDDF